MNGLTCRRRGCGARLEIQVVGSLGMTAEWCPRCERNQRGLCRDCPRQLDSPRKMRCAACRRGARLAAQHRYDAQRWSDPARAAAMLERMRIQRARPEARERTRRYNRDYHQRNPTNNTDRARRRLRYHARYHGDPVFRTHESRRQVRWRQAKRRASRCQREIDRLTPIVTALLARAA